MLPYFTDFDIGFEFTNYEVLERDEAHNDTVYIVKTNDKILQMNYTFTIEVIHSQGLFPAVLSKWSQFSLFIGMI